MKNLLSVLVLTIIAGSAQANTNVLGIATSVADADLKNAKIVKVEALKGVAAHQVPNPEYGNCYSLETPGTTCEIPSFTVPGTVDRYQVTIQYFSADNADISGEYDGPGPQNIVTKYVEFPASKADGLKLTKDSFVIGGFSEKVKSDGKYWCNGGTEGPDTNGPVCYSPSVSTNYYLTLSIKK